MKRRRTFVFTILFIGSAGAGPFAAPARAGEPVHWPQWRGPDGNGTTRALGLPQAWSESKNIVWKVPLPSWSAATPVIWGDRLFVISPESVSRSSDNTPRQSRGQDSDGSNGRGQRALASYGGDRLNLLCMAKNDGRVFWIGDLGGGNGFDPGRRHNMCTPSPVTDGLHVWALTATGVLAAFDMNGRSVWRRNLIEEYGPFGQMFTYGSSPLLLDDRIIVEVIHGTHAQSPSYLLAVDKRTGKNVWKVERATTALQSARDAYTTPILMRYPDRQEILISGGNYVSAHDIATGRQVWRANVLNPTQTPRFRLISSPVVYEDMIFVSGRRSPLTALRNGGSGDVTRTHVVWSHRRGTDVPTPVCDGTYLYVVEDAGRAVCIDVKTGQNTWPESARLPRGTYWSSPLLADGRLYATNQTGTTTVLAAGPAFKVLATNQLDDDYVLASFVVSERRLYLRGSQHLYCIGHKP